MSPNQPVGPVHEDNSTPCVCQASRSSPSVKCPRSPSSREHGIRPINPWVGSQGQQLPHLFVRQPKSPSVECPRSPSRGTHANWTELYGKTNFKKSMPAIGINLSDGRYLQTSFVCQTAGTIISHKLTTPINRLYTPQKSKNWTETRQRQLIRRKAWMTSCVCQATGTPSVMKLNPIRRKAQTWTKEKSWRPHLFVRHTARMSSVWNSTKESEGNEATTR